MIPSVQIPTKRPSNFGLIALLNITIEGTLSVVTAITVSYTHLTLPTIA